MKAARFVTKASRSHCRAKDSTTAVPAAAASSKQLAGLTLLVAALLATVLTLVAVFAMQANLAPEVSASAQLFVCDKIHFFPFCQNFCEFPSLRRHSYCHAHKTRSSPFERLLFGDPTLGFGTNTLSNMTEVVHRVINVTNVLQTIRSYRFKLRLDKTGERVLDELGDAGPAAAWQIRDCHKTLHRLGLKMNNMWYSYFTTIQEIRDDVEVYNGNNLARHTASVAKALHSAQDAIHTTQTVLQTTFSEMEKFGKITSSTSARLNVEHQLQMAMENQTTIETDIVDSQVLRDNEWRPGFISSLPTKLAELFQSKHENQDLIAVYKMMIQFHRQLDNLTLNLSQFQALLDFAEERLDAIQSDLTNVERAATRVFSENAVLSVLEAKKIMKICDQAESTALAAMDRFYKTRDTTTDEYTMA
eukprot:m.261067 g.261067  ORF g.261067 m.261067 type:complete len:418 (-) comp15572_c0_seq1:243-1496(-)